MKSKLLILCTALTVVSAAAAAVNGTGSAEEKEMIHTLPSHVWLGTRIEMPGSSSSVQDVFGGGIKLTLQENGTCVFEMRGGVLRAKWTIKKDEIRIRGKGIDTKRHFDPGDPLIPGFPPMLTLYEIENYMVTFCSGTIRGPAGLPA